MGWMAASATAGVPPPVLTALPYEYLPYKPGGQANADELLGAVEERAVLRAQ